jgi:Icc-related predicted phosphoesterase
VIRIAAVGDIHLGADSKGTYRPRLACLADQADLFLLAGDLTRRGTEAEGEVVAGELAGLGVPTIAVLGNHDYESGAAAALVANLETAGVVVLEGTSTTCQVNGCTVGVAGVKGFGGGFPGRCGSAFGEPEMKAFIHHTEDTARRLCGALEEIAGADLKVALTHYSPVADTLQGEHCEIYPFLGSYLLAEAVDGCPGAALAVHGHAHGGAPRGVTAGGVPVRNVALPVIQSSYRVFCLEERLLVDA